MKIKDIEIRGLKMIINEIENLKKKLNDMIGSDEFTYNEILKVSQELDILIVKQLRMDYMSAV
jgi:hypothetical protein